MVEDVWVSGWDYVGNQPFTKKVSLSGKACAASERPTKQWELVSDVIPVSGAIVNISGYDGADGQRPEFPRPAYEANQCMPSRANPLGIMQRYGDPITGILHPIGEAALYGCHCKNCDNRWVDILAPQDDWTPLGKPPLNPSAINAAGQSMVADISNASSDDLAAMRNQAREALEEAEIPVTEDMIDAGREAWNRSIEEECSITTYELVYRAMAALAPAESSLEPLAPTKDDIYNLAIALIAAQRDGMFRQAKEEFLASDSGFKNEWLRIAQAAFAHAGYLPSIVAQRRDFANQKVLLAPDRRALQRELDTVNAQVRLREGTIERQARAMLEAQEREIALRMELMAAQDALAKLKADVPDTPNPPMHDPFRHRERDRRRMGPEGLPR